MHSSSSQCLGLGVEHPEWMRVSHFPRRRDFAFLTLAQEPDSVRVLCEKIKTFPASQGMIRGYSGPGPAILASNHKF